MPSCPLLNQYDNGKFHEILAFVSDVRMYYLLNMIGFSVPGRLLQCNSTHIFGQLQQLDTHWEIWEQPTYFCRGWRSVSIRPGRWRPPGPPSTGCASRLSNMQFDRQFRCVSQTEQGQVVGTDLDSSRALRTVSRSSWEQHVLHSAVEVLGPVTRVGLPYCTQRHSIAIVLRHVATIHPPQPAPDVSFRFLLRRGLFTFLDPARSGITWE